MNKIVSIRTGLSKAFLDELRRAFSVPKRYTDERLFEALLNIVVDDYMNVEKIEAEALQGHLTEGKIAERWL